MSRVWMVGALVVCIFGCGSGAVSSSGGSGGMGEGGAPDTATTVTSGGSTATTAPECTADDDGNECSDDIAVGSIHGCYTDHYALHGIACGGGACFHGHCVPSDVTTFDVESSDVTVYVAAKTEVGDQAVQPWCFGAPVSVVGFWVAAPCSDNLCMPDGEARIFEPATAPADPNGAVTHVGYSGVGQAPFVLLTSQAGDIKLGYRLFMLDTPLDVAADDCVYVSREMTAENLVASIDADATTDGWWCTDPTAATLGGCGPMSGPYPGVSAAHQWTHGILFK